MTTHHSIDGIDGYTITDDGEVWSWFKRRRNLPAVLSDVPNHPLRPQKGIKRYEHVILRLRGRNEPFPVHVLARLAFVGRTDTGEHREIEGHPDYTVTSTGEVWRWRHGAPYYHLAPEDITGYLRVTFGRSACREWVHRLVLKAFVGPHPDGMETRHLNGNRGDNRVENLVWGTRAENAADKRRHGSTRNHARLTEDDVRSIREAVRDGASSAEVAQRFGVVPGYVRQIVTRRAWSHI